MGWFDWLFGRKPVVGGPDAPGAAAPPPRSDAGPPVPPPSALARAVALQRSYWTHDPDEQARLQARGADGMQWGERLRLHHLLCVQHAHTATGFMTMNEALSQSVRGLGGADSPYRPRRAIVWQGARPGSARPAEMTGQLYNPSITHLGCLEVCRLDADQQPVRLDFVSFDALSRVVFAQPSLLRGATLTYRDGRVEAVLAPLLYGLTWTLGDQTERSGQMTRFMAHVRSEEAMALQASGIGIGQQDWTSHGGGAHLFALSSVTELSFPGDEPPGGP